jgi:hypothetical protein
MKNKKLFIVSILYIFWLLISFGLIYFLMANEVGGSWAFSGHAFKRYLLFVWPISVAWAAYILTSGKLLNIKDKIKSTLIVSSLLLVFAFTIIQWTSVTTLYGQYGASVRRSPGEAFLLAKVEDVTPYEYATLYRGAMETRYDITFKKIWTFDFVIFFSTLLLLYILDKDKINKKYE